MSFSTDIIRVFVGASERQQVPALVLGSSICRRTSRRVVVTPIHQVAPTMPLPRNPENRPRTDFSFQRFLVPELAGYAGRAIYLDSDMIVFHDIADLWEFPFCRAEVLACSRSGATPQFSVLVLDCDRLRWNLRELVGRLDQGTLTYRELMDFKFDARVSASIPDHWNSIEHYQPGATALLHYSRQPTQPWLQEGHPLEHLWVEELKRAVSDGFLDVALVREHIRNGWLRSLLINELSR